MTLRVLLTRATEDNASLAEALRAAGVDVIEVPTVARVVRPEALDQARATCADPDVLLFTSHTAVEAFGPARSCPVRPKRVAAIGPRTRSVAEAHGWTVSAGGDQGLTGSALVAALGEIRGRDVLWPRPAEATPGTRDALAAAGARLHDVVAYENREPPGLREALAAAPAVDIVVLAAPSAAQRVGRFLRGALPEALALGPTTAAAAREIGFQPVTTVAIDRLVDAVTSRR
jgi:uroporphyrinogen-III synthase